MVWKLKEEFGQVPPQLALELDCFTSGLVEGDCYLRCMYAFGLGLFRSGVSHTSASLAPGFSFELAVVSLASLPRLPTHVIGRVSLFLVRPLFPEPQF